MGWGGERAIKQRQLLQAHVRQLREKTPCADCGQQYPWYIMEFDHCRGEKDTEIARMVRAPVSLPRLQREIEKCDLVCANCHRARTYGRLGLVD